MDLAAFQALLTDEGQRLLDEAASADLSKRGLVSTATRLRGRYPAELVPAALTQAVLRVRARAKFGELADRMYFTAEGLEQATRASVAAYRAQRFTDVTGPVLDLCCGIGGDSIFLTQAGHHVMAMDRDPLTVAVARANFETLGLGHRATVREGDVVGEADPRDCAALFADPGRRTGERRTFAPEDYEPPLSTVTGLARQASGACLKVAPGIPHEAIPEDVEAEWISDGGDVKEAALWFGELAGDVTRRATLLGAKPATLLQDPSIGPPPVTSWRRYLYEPDGAVIRAHLVAEVAARLDGALADPRIAYITTDRLTETPYARPYEISEVMPFSVKRLRAALRTRQVGTLTIKKRGSAVDVERLRQDLRLRGGEEAVLVVTRVGAAPVALLCEQVKKTPNGITSAATR